MEGHTVRWDHNCEYDVSLRLLPDGMVDSFVERLCVRMETDGGRSTSKVGS